MRKSITAIIIILSILVLYMSLFIIKEGERGIKFQFSSVVRDINRCPVIYEPGLHFKIPVIQSVKKLEARIQTMENQADHFVTKEKKDLIVNSYIKWRINDFSRYFLATGDGNVAQAEIILKRKFSDRLRSEIAKLDIKDIVTNSRKHLTLKVINMLNTGSTNIAEKHEMSISTTSDSNTETTSKKIKTLNPNSMAVLGIEIIDVRIKQTNFPIEVSEAVYSRIRAEREAIARKLRSQGQEEAEKLRAAADYEVTKTLAEAKRQGRILRGEGDAEAAKLFARTFSENPEFYTFIRSLQAYENSFHNHQNIIVLSPNNEFLRYMNTTRSHIQ